MRAKKVIQWVYTVEILDRTLVPGNDEQCFALKAWCHPFNIPENKMGFQKVRDRTSSKGWFQGRKFIPSFTTKPSFIED